MCNFCDNHYTLGGPIWIDRIHDPEFLELLKANLEESETRFNTFKRMKGMIQMISEELVDVPLFYSVDALCQKLHTILPPIEVLRSAFLNSGYKVSYSHAHRSSLKTDAPNEVLWDIFKAWALKNRSQKKNYKERQNDSGLKILSQPITTLISFEVQKDAQPLSRELKLLRFQINPTRFWGPKSKPRNANQVDKRALNQGKRVKLKKSLDVHTAIDSDHN